MAKMELKVTEVAELANLKDSSKGRTTVKMVRYNDRPELYLDIRKQWRRDESDDWKPTAKGISLSKDAWDALKAQVGEIDKLFAGETAAK